MKKFSLILVLISSAAWAQAPSASERVEQLEAAKKSVAQPIRGSDDPKDQVTVSGTIRTEDGKPVPKDTRLDWSSASESSTHMSSTGKVGEKFSAKIRPGEIWLGISASGYAPINAGPFRGDPAGEVKDVEIVLKSGFAASVQLTDEQGKPIPKANATAKAEMKVNFADIKLTSDENGIITIAHAADAPYRFNLDIDGFEAERSREVHLKPNETVALKLHRAEPTDGVVMNSDGNPVAGAKMRLCAEVEGEENRNMYGWDGPVLATTDKDGRFHLSTLRHDRTYVVLIETTRDGKDLVRDLRAGQLDRRITLAPKRTITGKITGDLSKLEQRKGQPIISSAMTLTIFHSSYVGQGEAVPVKIEGDEGRFTIDNVPPVEFNISAGTKHTRIDASQPLQEISLDLSSEEAAKAKRRVVIQLKSDDSDKPPRGTVVITAYKQNEQQIDRTEELKDGKVTIDAYAGGWLRWKLAELPGYWFPEGNQQIPAADDELTIDVPAIPAGALLGHVTDDAGKPLPADVSVSVEGVDRSERIPKNIYFQNIQNLHPDANGKVIASSLPLDGSYVLKVNRDKTFALSEPVKVDESQLMPQVELKLPKGVDVEVQLLDPDGKPLPATPVSFTYNSPYGGHGFSPDPKTDDQGKIKFSGINFEAPGDYSVTAESRRDYQPTKINLSASGPNTIRLEKGHVVTGKVIDDASGWPVPGAEVVASENGSPMQYKTESRTDDEGHFRFSNLPDRPVELRVGDVNLAGSGAAPSVTPDGSDEVEVRVKLITGSKLKPKEPAGTK